MPNPTKQGRPALPEHERRNNVLNVRLTDAELAEVREAAGPYPVAIWIRVKAVEAARKEQER